MKAVTAIVRFFLKSDYSPSLTLLKILPNVFPNSYFLLPFNDDKLDSNLMFIEMIIMFIKMNQNIRFNCHRFIFNSVYALIKFIDSKSAAPRVYHFLKRKKNKGKLASQPSHSNHLSLSLSLSLSPSQHPIMEIKLSNIPSKFH